MGNILKVLKRDFARLFTVPAAWVIMFGMVFIPPLYSWYNIVGFWDPYGNTKALKVAVANVDKGYKSDLMPITINVGETVTNTLRANHDLDWQFVDKIGRAHV